MLCCWKCGRSISGGILCAPCKAIEAAEIEASKPIDWQSRALTAEAEVERLRAERIVGPALRHGGITIHGRAKDHCDHGKLMNHDQLAMILEGDQGFITSNGRFVDRVEGLAIARNANQIIREVGNGDELFSEMLFK